MELTLKHLRTNEYNHDHEEVPEGTPYGFWRIVEYTGAGWFPWPTLYKTRNNAEQALSRVLKNPKIADLIYGGF